MQLFNVPLVLATALLTFLLARLLWPQRGLLQVAAAAFVAFTPVVIKTGAMFHPETLSLFLSTLGLYVAARLIARGRLGWLPGLALGAVLGVGQLVRSQAAWTFAACALVLLLLLAGDVARRRALAATLAGLLVGTAAVAGWWYVRQTVEYGSPLDYKHTAFTVAGTHPGASVGPWTLDKPVWERRPLSFYVDPGLPELFSRPYRPSYLGAGIPVTYSELWGDWLGVWRRNPDVSPTPAATRELGVQNGVGLLPTLLGLGRVRRARGARAAPPRRGCPRSGTHRRVAARVRVLRRGVALAGRGRAQGDIPAHVGARVGDRRCVRARSAPAPAGAGARRRRARGQCAGGAAVRRLVRIAFVIAALLLAGCGGATPRGTVDLLEAKPPRLVGATVDAWAGTSVADAGDVTATAGRTS